MSRLAFLLLSLSLSSSVFAVLGPVTDLHISNVDIAPDGFKRPAVVVNGQFPAPLIVGYKGDNFRVNVIDELTNHTMLKSTSIHWHGMFQKGTNWADGPAFINQCPITSGHSFLYDFSGGQQAGTFWYHSHLSLQYCDGLRGPLIIKDPEDPHQHLYDVDDENTVITLAEWYHTAAPLIPGVASAQSTLFNGLGRYPGGPKTELAVFNVEHGKRYRFRLISISCDPNFVFSIDGHDMTIIEVEGINSQPYTVDSIQIFAAQRYSFVVTANQPIKNYWIRAQPDNTALTGFAGGINSAILRYVGAPCEEPTTAQSPSIKPMNEVDLHPLANIHAPGTPIPGHANVPINLALGFDTTLGKFTINGTPFTPPSVPVLLQILSGAKNPHELLPAGSIISLPRNAVVEISFPITNGTVALSGPHPFHMHGHVFSVVRSAGSETYNYENPIWRDTVSIGDTPGRDNVTIRFETNNPGPWILHCHIDFHLNAGFAVVLAEENNLTASSNPVPEAWKELCPLYDALDPSDT